MTATPAIGMEHKFLGFRVTQLTARRIENFRRNQRGTYSLFIFLGLMVVSLFAEVIANDKPIVVSYQGALYFPAFKDYPETTFGGSFVTEANYRSAYVRKKIEADGWMVWPPIPFSYDTTITDLPGPAPSPRRHQLARHRRPGAGRDGARHLRIPHSPSCSALRSRSAPLSSASWPARSRVISAAGSTCCSSASWKCSAACRRSTSC